MKINTLLLFGALCFYSYIHAAPLPDKNQPETMPDSPIEQATPAKNEALIRLKELRLKVPKICVAQCKQEGHPWRGRIILPGSAKRIDYLKAEITEDMNFRCFCNNVQTSKNNAPIWSNIDAQNKCPDRCSQEIDQTTGESGMKWTGHWWTTVWNKRSVCQCASY